MPKTVKLEPIGQETLVLTNDNLLSGLLTNELKVMQECGGRGMCATCHVFIKEGMEHLSPMSRREQRTLGVITTCRSNSRLACQCKVMGNGVVVELPTGMYLNDMSDVECLVGQRAEENILHPISGQILIQAGKLITRSMIRQLEETRTDALSYLTTNSGE